MSSLFHRHDIAFEHVARNGSVGAGYQGRLPGGGGQGLESKETPVRHGPGTAPRLSLAQLKEPWEWGGGDGGGGNGGEVVMVG